MKIILIVFLFLEKLRKVFLPKVYYNWEEKLKQSVQQKVKESRFFVILLTTLFTLLFGAFVFIGVRPWYSVWVLLLGLLFVFFKYKKIIILEKMYLSVLTASIVPTLILARLIFIESFFFLAEVLGNVWPVQQKMLLSVGTLLLVFPEGTVKKAVHLIKTFSQLQSNCCDEFPIKYDLGQVSGGKKNSDFFKGVAIKEKAMHFAKVSNLIKIEGKSILSEYKYVPIISQVLKAPLNEGFNGKYDLEIVSFLNSSEITDFIMKLKETRRTMGADEFARILNTFLQGSVLSDLTVERTNLLFNMLFTKAATDELPLVLLKKGTLDLLYDRMDNSKTLECAVKTQMQGFDKIFNGDAYMKLIKEQRGLAVQERYLNKMGLNIIDAVRDAKVDYKIKQSDGQEILLECKSRAPEFLNAELQNVQTKLKEVESFNLFWENTKTWDKTLFKVTKNDYTEIYKEAPEKKVGR